MAKKFVTVEEYMGRKLTGGSYYQWMARMMQIISAVETGNQQFSDYVAEIQTLLTKLSQLIKQAGAFEDTPAVKAADYWRDRAFTAIFMHIYYCNFLPTGSCLAAAAKKLYPQVKPYKSLQQHEMTLETSEITGFLRVLNAEGNQEAVATLGLTEIISELAQQNTIIQTEMAKREQEDAARNQMKEGETMGTVRAQIGDIYETMLQMLNAFVIMGNASVTAAVPELNAVIDHYQQIEAQKDGKATGDPSTPGGTGSNENNNDPSTGGSGQDNQGGSGTGTITPGGGDNGGLTPDPSPSGEGDDNGSGSGSGGDDNGGGGGDVDPSGGGDI